MVLAVRLQCCAAVQVELPRASDGFAAANPSSRMPGLGRPLPTAEVGYPVAQLGGQLSSGEIARPTDGGRRIGISNGLSASRKPESALDGRAVPAWMAWNWAWNWRLRRCLVLIRPAPHARLELARP